MRERIVKWHAGRNPINSKELTLNVIKNGHNNKSAFAVSIVFQGDAYKKATSSEYVIIEIDRDESRLYFATGNSYDGFKLSRGNSPASARNVKFTTNDPDFWTAVKGSYDLKKILRMAAITLICGGEPWRYPC